jgi:hypothetical protein
MNLLGQMKRPRPTRAPPPIPITKKIKKKSSSLKPKENQSTKLKWNDEELKRSGATHIVKYGDSKGPKALENEHNVMINTESIGIHFGMVSKIENKDCKLELEYLRSLRGPDYESKGTIQEPSAIMIRTFCNFKKGNKIIIGHGGNDIDYIAEVTGEYFFREDYVNVGYPHRVPIKILHTFPKGTQREKKCICTLIKLK